MGHGFPTWFHQRPCNVQVLGREVVIGRGTVWETFDRDCCLLLENYFFARGEGIAFDAEALSILLGRNPISWGSTPTRFLAEQPTAKSTVSGERSWQSQVIWPTALWRG